jgi:periplasmic protein CpxP/Spy
MKIRAFLSISLCSVFLFAAGAYAQMPPPPPPPPSGGYNQQMPSPSVQLQQLHDALNLRPDQDANWQAYAHSTTVDRGEMMRRRDAMQRMAGASAPQRVDLSIQMMKEDVASMERRGAALKEFYATLTPQQQSTFDEVTMRRPGSGM